MRLSGKRMNRYIFKNLKQKVKKVKKIEEQKVDAAENISKDLKAAALNSKMLLDEKVAPINNLPLLIDKKTSYRRAKQVSTNLGVEEANKAFCDKLETINKRHQINQKVNMFCNNYRILNHNLKY